MQAPHPAARQITPHPRSSIIETKATIRFLSEKLPLAWEKSYGFWPCITQNSSPTFCTGTDDENCSETSFRSAGGERTTERRRRRSRRLSADPHATLGSESK